MAAVIMPQSPSFNQPSGNGPARRNLKRPAPVGAETSMRSMVPIIRTPGLSAPRSPMLTGDKMLPSQLPRSPASANPWSAGNRNEDMKTPITPPSAYSDFLTALSPAMSTPATARSAFSNFSFTDRNGRLTPITQPPSAASFHGHTPNESKRRAPPAPLALTSMSAAVSAPLVPPSPFVRPNINRRTSLTARTPTTLKKLTIPESPSFSPVTESASNSAIGKSPSSAKASLSAPALNYPGSSTRSPYPTSAELRSPFSPTSWYQEGRTRTIVEPPKGAGVQTVQVRQVVTRTVTYTRTPLEPAPKRRRRMREGEAPTPIDPRMHVWPVMPQKAKPESKEEDEDSGSDLSGSTISSSDGSDASEQGSVRGDNDRDTDGAAMPTFKVENASDDDKA